jgi:DNA polymerase-1
VANDLGLTRTERKAITEAILTPYLTAKKDRTLIQQYERARGGPDGRSRTVLSTVVTETGRLASGESFVDEGSTNQQNFSKHVARDEPLYAVRDCFIPDPGFVLVGTDLDKAEAVVMAFESENWEFYDRLIAGEDVHKWIAAQAYYGGDESKVEKGVRDRCKNVLYASLYMAGIKRITATINKDAKRREDKLTEGEVTDVYNVLMDILHLDKWWDRVWRDLMDPKTHGGYRWLENALGFRRMFYNPDRHKCWKEAVNFFPQSTVASVIDHAMTVFWDTLDSPGEVELILQVHDELLYQVREDLVDEIIPKLVALMQEPFIARGREVYIPSSAEVGKRWGQMQKWSAS